MNHGKLGKLPASEEHRFYLAKYLNRSTIPAQVPISYEDFLKNGRDQHGNIVKAAEWNMYANGPDLTAPAEIAAHGVGDCFWAAACHAIMARSASAGRLVVPTVLGCLAAYAGCTKWDINDPNSDLGTPAMAGMKYLKSTGIMLPDGSFNKIAAFVAVNPKDPEEIQIAHAIFGGVLIGVVFYKDWEDAPVWSHSDGKVLGGHMIYGFSNLNPEGLNVCTWGEDRLIPYASLAENCDEMFVVVDDDILNPDGITVTGFDKEQLNADLSSVALAQ